MINNAQKLIKLISPDLPIRAYPTPPLLPNLRKQFPEEEITVKTGLEICALLNMGEEGGVMCEVIPIGLDPKNAKAVFLCSITHLKIKKGEAHYSEIVKYQVKRVRKLARQNRF